LDGFQVPGRQGNDQTRAGTLSYTLEIVGDELMMPVVAKLLSRHKLLKTPMQKGREVGP
jgi:hypothetical protein